jgi:6-phosphogluconolactonase/glucosamine-6-phosphate isomerase/deaminase
MRIIIADDVVEAATRLIAEQLQLTLTKADRASVAFSGGRIAWAVLARLAEIVLPWERVHV